MSQREQSVIINGITFFEVIKINKTVSDLDGVISSIQSSTTIQEEKIDLLEQVRKNSEQLQRHWRTVYRRYLSH